MQSADVTALKEAYPSAELVVVELEDWDRDIDLSGPVIRLRRAGADAYLAANRLEDLARQLQPTAADEIAATTHEALPRELRSTSVDHIVLHLLDERAAVRTAAPPQRNTERRETPDADRRRPPRSRQQPTTLAQERDSNRSERTAGPAAASPQRCEAACQRRILRRLPDAMRMHRLYVAQPALVGTLRGGRAHIVRGHAASVVGRDRTGPCWS